MKRFYALVILALSYNSFGQVGINTTTPTSMLDVNGQVTIDQKNFGGYGGLLIKGDAPGNNYPNIAFSILNDSGNDQIAGYIGGNINDNTTGNEAMDLSFLTSSTGLVGLSEKMRIKDNGNVGIGITNPSEKLEIAGKIKITDGTEGVGKVLVSDAAGVGSWQPIGINNISATLGSGVNVPYTTTNYLQTGTSITLPPGRYAVNVTMLLSQPGNALTPANSSFWLRSTFSDSPAANPISSSDIQGSSLVSGNFSGSSFFSLMNGTIIINNTNSSSKTYYYVAGTTSVFNTTGTVALIGGNLAENNIIAYKLQ